MEQEHTGEGFTQLQRTWINTFAQTLDRTGAKTTCVIGFGSRAREEGRPNSDADLIVVLNFKKKVSPENPNLRRVQQTGEATNTIVAEGIGTFHLQFIKENHLKFNIRLPIWLLPSMSIPFLLKTSAALEAKLLYGEEPFIWRKPLLRYIKNKARR